MAKQQNEQVVVFDDLGFSISVSGSVKADAGAASIADLTTGWKPQVVLDGEVLPFSRDNALVLYQRRPAIIQKIKDECK